MIVPNRMMEYITCYKTLLDDSRAVWYVWAIPMTKPTIDNLKLSSIGTKQLKAKPEKKIQPLIEGPLW